MGIACGITTRENSIGMASLEISMSCMNGWDVDIVIRASSWCPWTNSFCSFCCLGWEMRSVGIVGEIGLGF